MAEFEPIDAGPDGTSWDAMFADRLVDRLLLVGLTYVDHEDRLVRREQRFGTVISVDADEGIVIRQSDSGALFTIAPILDAIEPGQPGIYQLSDTDAVVENPDFTALFTIRFPAPE